MSTSRTARLFRQLPLVIAMGMTVGMATLTSPNANAHGYIESPKSRAFMCSTGGGRLNSNCGPVEYEPQSVEYFADGSRAGYPSTGQACHGEFTRCGPADGTIAAGGMSGFAKLNEQTSNRWKKNSIKPGKQTFTWNYTQSHKTHSYQFYITKKNWSPNQPLTRASFDMTPLLDEQWGGRMPGAKTQHTLNIPADRSGYHIVLATWKVGDNSNTFYQVVDLNIDNPGAGSLPVNEVAQSVWTDIGNVQPETLKVGDKVRTRVFTGQGEQLNKQVVLDISTTAMADKNTWTQELAKKVNAANLGYQMGELNAKDQVIPSLGKNTIYANKDSGITSVLIDKIPAVIPTKLKVSGLQAEYPIKDGQVQLHVNAQLEHTNPKDNYLVFLEVFNAAGNRIHYVPGDAGNLAPQFTTQLKDIEPGQYDLVIVSRSEKGQMLQQTLAFKVTPEAISAKYDYAFPQGLKSYQAGTLVLQPKDGQVYQCKPLPFSSYCKQWKADMNVFEPGVGSAWEWGWTRQ